MPIVGSNGKSTKPPVTPALSSEWGGLSPHLIATIYEVDRAGKRPEGTENIFVKAPILDGTFSVSLNWSSPFESAGIEVTQPTIIAMLQSGAFQPVLDSIGGALGKVGVTIDPKAKDFLKGFEGRTGITKLNSTQTFSGMPPLDYPITLLFRAWRDPKEEVMKPLNKLMSWLLPQKLADQSTLLSRAADFASGKDRDYINILLPSFSPVMVAINYKGMTFKPMVIENISYDTASPVDENGDFVSLPVQLKLNSLTAIDKDDWSGFRSNTT